MEGQADVVMDEKDKSESTGKGGRVTDEMDKSGNPENGNNNKLTERVSNKQSPKSTILGVLDRNVTKNNKLYASKLDYLVKSVNDKHDSFLAALLSSKEVLEKRKQFESAFSKEAFLEVVMMLMCHLEDRQIDCSMEDIKKVIREEINNGMRKDDEAGTAQNGSVLVQTIVMQRW